MQKEWNDDITKRYNHRSLLDFIARSMTYTQVIDYRQFLTPEYNDFYSLNTSYYVNDKDNSAFKSIMKKDESKKILIPKHCITEDGAIRMGFIVDLMNTEGAYIPHVKVAGLHLKTRELMEIDYTLDNINLYNKKKPNSYTKEDIGRLLDQRESILNALENLIELPQKQLEDDNNERKENS